MDSQVFKIARHHRDSIITCLLTSTQSGRGPREVIWPDPQQMINGTAWAQL